MEFHPCRGLVLSACLPSGSAGAMAVIEAQWVMCGSKPVPFPDRGVPPAPASSVKPQDLAQVRHVLGWLSGPKTGLTCLN